MRRDYALFRYPGDKEDCYLVEADSSCTVTANGMDEIAGRTGFVFAPFEVSKTLPLILIPGKKRPVNDIPEMETAKHNGVGEVTEDRGQYASDYRTFHEAISCGKVDKAVLARSSKLEISEIQESSSLFKKACRLYPNSFVALIDTATTGTWLMATPEVLLEEVNGRWHTMALAGTMTERETEKNDWSEKNMAEQRYVAVYIRKILKRFADDISEVGPITVKAGCVSHLKTDFLFDIKKDVIPCSLVSALNPTPAVCGLPKEPALALIRESEHLDRKYYSGFCGFIGDSGDFRLYVTLRCMNLCGNKAELYAGGGIMADSREEDEWAETRRKMNAMRDVLGI